MEEIQARHRKEQRDLQARVTQKKKNATKKTRKGVNDECERLERDLAERQRAEIDAASERPIEIAVEDLHLTDPEETVHDPSGATEGSVSQPVDQEASSQEPHARSKKPNRQKARLARRAAEQEAEATAAAEEAANMPDLRQQELSSMKEHMEKLNLKETFIRPDGHCLYSACALNLPKDQLKQSGSAEGFRAVRSAAADFIAHHPEEFEAFLEEPLDNYVRKIKDTAEWGGQLELQAISRFYKVTINVLQADGRVEKISPGEGASTVDVWLAYYRHSFGLGEHYNALEKTDD